jgi:hypothetical protein
MTRSTTPRGSATPGVTRAILSLILAPLLVAALTGCSDDTKSGGTIAVQISGEDAATAGFRFPTGSEVSFADGWQLEFEHVLVTVGAVTISANPSKAPSDQSATDAAVARVVGPWAVDLSVEGSVLAAGGEGKATPITTIERQNLKGDAPFVADEQYAFGYDLVVADDGATKVNFDGDEETESAYATMVEQGYSMLMVGTASWKGAECRSSSSSYDFSAIPAEVPFELGFRTPTSYLNCQNQENDGEPFENEEYPRGIALLPNQSTVAEVSLHLEHPWFSSIVHDSGLYFDQMAARLVGRPDGATLTLDDLAGVDPSAFTDGLDEPLPWRVCTDADLSPGQRGFDVGDIPIDPEGNPASAFRDYRDLVSYLESTEGHLNGGEGLCFVKRNYPSPP